jgi:hypothetical protein
MTQQMITRDWHMNNEMAFFRPTSFTCYEISTAEMSMRHLMVRTEKKSTTLEDRQVRRVIH